MLESCSLDPLPASVTKNCLDISFLVITKIVNLFLSSRAIPDAFKIAELLPALRNLTLILQTTLILSAHFHLLLRNFQTFKYSEI